MKREEVLGNLCYYDSKNPNSACDDDCKPRADCYCDNCFYGRDELALEIIQLWSDVAYVTSIVADLAEEE